MDISTPIRIAADRVEGEVIAKKSREALKAFGTSAPPKVIADTAYMLIPEDTGLVLLFTAATTVSLTVPATLPVGFSATPLQWGAGTVNLIGDATFRSPGGLTGTPEQYDSISLYVPTNSSGSNAEVLVA